MIYCDPHEVFLLRDAPHYCGDDEILAELYPQLYDRARLSNILDQYSVAVKKGTYWIKQNPSTFGLGKHVKRHTFPHDVVLQPEYSGRYLNIDCYQTGDAKYLWVYGGFIKNGRFQFFQYIPERSIRLTKVQQEKLATIMATVEKNTPVNVEFLGDQVLEAHARFSLQMSDLPAAAGDADPVEVIAKAQTSYAPRYLDWALYSIPIWVENPIDHIYSPYELKNILGNRTRLLSAQWPAFHGEPAIHGKHRVAIINVATYTSPLKLLNEIKDRFVETNIH